MRVVSSTRASPRHRGGALVSRGNVPEMKGFYGAIMVFDNGDKRWDGV